VTHEARVVVDLVDRNDDLMVMHVLTRGREGFDLERSGGSIACYVDAPHDPGLVAEDFVERSRISSSRLHGSRHGTPKCGCTSRRTTGWRSSRRH
jgi:hypothetical protein